MFIGTLNKSGASKCQSSESYIKGNELEGFNSWKNMANKTKKIGRFIYEVSSEYNAFEMRMCALRICL